MLRRVANSVPEISAIIATHNQRSASVPVSGSSAGGELTVVDGATVVVGARVVVVSTVVSGATTATGTGAGAGAGAGAVVVQVDGPIAIP